MSSIDAGEIHDALLPDVAGKLDQLEIFPEIDSTNSYLMAQPAPAPGRLRVAIADHQTAGRGRHDRPWLSAPGSSLCLSIAYTFRGALIDLPGLTLAAGVAALAALREAGIDDIQLKWPNDLVAKDGKLGGMLAESHRRGGTNVCVVIGVGINVDLPMALLRDTHSNWAQRAIDLQHLQKHLQAREVLAAAFVNCIIETLTTFETEGFAAFADDWRRHDWLRGREITVEQTCGAVTGTACGIDDDGALLLDAGDGTMRVLSGSIIIDSERPGPS